MLFYSDDQIRKELSSILQEDDSLEPSYNVCVYHALSKDIDSGEAETSRIRGSLVDLYEKKRDLTTRLSSLLKAIDERWLASPAGEESSNLTRLFNEATSRADVINDQANQIRNLILSLL